MIFYLIPAANGQPRQLTGTQNDAREVCKLHGIKFNAETMTHDIPTSKWELMNYINLLMHENDGLFDKPINSPTPQVVVVEADEAGPDSRSLAAVAKGFNNEIAMCAHHIRKSESKDLARLTSAFIERISELGKGAGE